ncbi:MAG: hypothetical protein IPM17_06865 [Verrucomicrobia bacterium]|nr:hypothetical protein [Verrucomicrobiota bacterium]
MPPLLLSVALFGFGATVTILANWLALRPWRRSAGEHWTERARLLWPARVGVVWNVLAAAALGTALTELVLRESAPPWYFRLLAGVGGGPAGSYFFDR